LVAGGQGASGTLNTAELYDPATGAFSATASMANARAFHAATLLLNGDVVVAGGQQIVADTPANILKSAELFLEPVFAGTPGSPNCHGTSVSALESLAAAATDLGFASVSALQNAITGYCGS